MTKRKIQIDKAAVTKALEMENQFLEMMKRLLPHVVQPKAYVAEIIASMEASGVWNDKSWLIRPNPPEKPKRSDRPI